MPQKVSKSSAVPAINKTLLDKYELSPFELAVQNALKAYHSAATLAQESPLATEYFLSAAIMNKQTAGTFTSGELLRTVLHQAAASLWGSQLPTTYGDMKRALHEERKTRGSDRYAYLILELRYFQQFFRPRTLREIYESDEYLLDSKAGDHRAHRDAIQKVAKALLTYCQPTLRLEQPRVSTTLIGYDVPLQQGCDALAAGRTVALVGPSGVGKTTLGMAIAQKLADRPTFWFTLRPTLNDRLSSLLFSLGHFLHEQGASQLWQFLAITEGNIQEADIAITLVRQALRQLGGRLPLLCFDEVDRLQQLDVDQVDPHYSQLFEFIESLQGYAPILLIGQRPLWLTDETIVLQGLQAAEIQQLAAQVGIQLQAEETMQLLGYSNGNPRTALLVLALQQSGERLADTLATLSQRAGLLPLLQRLWSRLATIERQLLQQLAVFRSFTPEAKWDVAVIQRLCELHLLVRDGAGGITLIPGLREALYQELPTELRQTLHQIAATIRAELGEHTAAAYHYHQADQSAQAIQLWYPQRQFEIRRGQAEAALAIFSQISARHLDSLEHKALDLIRAELRLMRGELRTGLAETEAIPWWDESMSAVRGHMLRGRLQESIGYPDAALSTYAQSARIARTLYSEVTSSLILAGQLQLRQSNLAEARLMARLAECHTQLLLAKVEDAEGRYTDARLSYQKALLTAEHLQDQPLLGMIHRDLGGVYGRLKALPEAVAHMQDALQIYKSIGDLPALEHVHNDLACIYIDNRQFAEAIAPAQKARRYFEAIHAPYMLSVACANLAEAYFELGEWQQAKHFAEEVISQEEPYTNPYGLFTLGRLHLQQNEWNHAENYLKQVIAIAGANEDTLMVAYAQRELGTLYTMCKQPMESTQALCQALTLFQRMGIDEEVRKTRSLLCTIENG